MVIILLRQPFVILLPKTSVNHLFKMLKSASGALANVLKRSLFPTVRASAVVPARSSHHGPVETDEEFDCRYEAYFNRQDIDGWEIRKAMTDLVGMDLVPDPRIIKAAMHACRRVNDYSLAIRIIEAVKDKCGPKVNEIYPYIIQEIKPTLNELGIETPEELGYDKPELALENVHEMQ